MHVGVRFFFGGGPRTVGGRGGHVGGGGVGEEALGAGYKKRHVVLFKSIEWMFETSG
jgi:hypothetical protein